MDSPVTDGNSNLGGNGCRLLLGLVIAMPIVAICVFFGYLSGFGDQLGFWLKSFEFPAIEARYKPIGDALAAVIADTLIEEKRHIDHITSETHKSSYMGCVGGSIDRIYGTNRAFEDVLRDYAKYFSTRPEWETWTTNDEGLTTRYRTHTAYVYFRVVEKSEYPIAWMKYPLVYEVSLVYTDPGLGCLG